jgi:hypothetical protein
MLVKANTEITGKSLNVGGLWEQKFISRPYKVPEGVSGKYESLF